MKLPKALRGLISRIVGSGSPGTETLDQPEFPTEPEVEVSELDLLIAEIETRPHGAFSLDSHFLRTPRDDVFFLFVDKVACTYVKQVLVSERFGDIHQLDPEYFLDNLNHHGLLHAIAGEVFTTDGRAVVRHPNRKIITFCRNPYERFLSAYQNKITRFHPIEREYHQGVRRHILFEALRSGRYENKLEEFRDGISLLHFAEYVRDSPQKQRDSHWSEQHLLNFADIIEPDELVRFENFQESFIATWKSYFGYVPELRDNFERNKSDRPKGIMSEQVAQIVYDIYRKDFELFGYDAESWKNF